MKRTQRTTTNQSGYTLIELVLYISLTSIMLLGIASFARTIIQAQTRTQVISAVEQQGIHTMQTITQAIRNAENVNSPTIGTTANLLSLDVATVANDPTVFSLNAGSIQMQEGAGTSVPLTNSKVTVSNLEFRNLSLANTPGIVQIEFTITHINPSGNKLYEYGKTFYGSATLR